MRRCPQRPTSRTAGTGATFARRRSHGRRAVVGLTSAAADPRSTYGVSQDGIFGPRTAQATRDFQARYDLTVDAVVGPLGQHSVHRLARVRVGLGDQSAAPRHRDVPARLPRLDDAARHLVQHQTRPGSEPPRQHHPAGIGQG